MFYFLLQTLDSLQLIFSQNFSDSCDTELSLATLLGENNSGEEGETSLFTSLRSLLLSADSTGEGEDAQMKDESFNQNGDAKTKTNSVSQFAENFS